MSNRFKYRLWNELEQNFKYYNLLNSESVSDFGYDVEEDMYDYNERVTYNHNDKTFVCLEQGCNIIDDDNKDLYEGDIVSVTRYNSDWTDDYIGIIKYFSEFNSLGIKTIDKRYNTAFAIDMLIKNIKLIGNIHQNKDILKEYNYE